MEKINIPQYDNYELHYSSSEQKVYSKFKKRYLKNNLNKGYYHVTLCNDKGKKNWRLNRLVWYVFNGDIPTDMQVNHINEDKTDNRISNLNLMTCKDNINYGTGIQRRTEKMIGVYINRQDQSKAIIGISKTTLELIEFPSNHEAQRQDKKFNNGNINQCCQHKRCKTVNGYYWFYKQEFNELLDEYQGNIQSIIKYKLSRY